MGCGGRGRVSVGGSFYGRTSIWRHFVRISEILEPACLLVSQVAGPESSLLFNQSQVCPPARLIS